MPDGHGKLQRAGAWNGKTYAQNKALGESHDKTTPTDQLLLIRFQDYKHVLHLPLEEARAAIPKFGKLDETMLAVVLCLFTPGQIGRRGYWRGDFNMWGSIHPDRDPIGLPPLILDSPSCYHFIVHRRSYMICGEFANPRVGIKQDRAEVEENEFLNTWGDDTAVERVAEARAGRLNPAQCLVFDMSTNWNLVPPHDIVPIVEAWRKDKRFGFHFHKYMDEEESGQCAAWSPAGSPTLASSSSVRALSSTARSAFWTGRKRDRPDSEEEPSTETPQRKSARGDTSQKMVPASRTVGPRKLIPASISRWCNIAGWFCPNKACQYLNPLSETKCPRCETPRPPQSRLYRRDSEPTTPTSSTAGSPDSEHGFLTREGSPPTRIQDDMVREVPVTGPLTVPRLLKIYVDMLTETKTLALSQSQAEMDDQAVETRLPVIQGEIEGLRKIEAGERQEAERLQEMARRRVQHADSLQARAKSLEIDMKMSLERLRPHLVDRQPNLLVLQRVKAGIQALPPAEAQQAQHIALEKLRDIPLFGVDDERRQGIFAGIFPGLRVGTSDPRSGEVGPDVDNIGNEVLGGVKPYDGNYDGQDLQLQPAIAEGVRQESRREDLDGDVSGRSCVSLTTRRGRPKAIGLGRRRLDGTAPSGSSLDAHFKFEEASPNQISHSPRFSLRTNRPSGIIDSTQSDSDSDIANSMQTDMGATETRNTLDAMAGKISLSPTQKSPVGRLAEQRKSVRMVLTKRPLETERAASKLSLRLPQRDVDPSPLKLRPTA
ncbi:hypothetical protein AYL99_11799 [Fonsecaea erecta]|uniref:RanBP2-type domain-containing protein n=1 Tax=Fonsecaea erecta TaxID=1367422 RepID=A0A178Z2L4_9EURO|nr:hypothetical protein AYL99_11799 [Fonsecaea erecta]OAP54039.1 hypothetical protein AYL99_11799 [Fonsecaea erecta]